MRIKIVATSKEILAKEDIKEVYVPTTSGIVGILPHYTNYVATLEIGEVKVRIGDDWQKFVINGGFVQVVKDEVLILADDAMQTDALVKSEIAEAITNAEQKLSSKLEPAELIRLEKILRYEKFKSQYVGI